LGRAGAADDRRDPAIGARRKTSKQAVTDAQTALADAIANGSDVTAATRQLQRAQEDITLDSLQKQAADQVRAQGQVVDAQQDALTKMLNQLRTKLTEQGEVYNDGMNDILAIIGQFDGPFADVGAALGDAFMGALLDAAKAAAAAGGAVKNPNARPTGGGVVSGVGSGRILHLARGGNITAAGLAFVHAGERVSPGSAAASPLTGGGGPVVHVTVNGWVGSDQDIAGRIRRELLRTGFQNSDIFGGRA
jgi:hypothetical protein